MPRERQSQENQPNQLTIRELEDYLQELNRIEYKLYQGSAIAAHSIPYAISASGTSGFGLYVKAHPYLSLAASPETAAQHPSLKGLVYYLNIGNLVVPALFVATSVLLAAGGYHYLRGDKMYRKGVEGLEGLLSQITQRVGKDMKNLLKDEGGLYRIVEVNIGDPSNIWRIKEIEKEARREARRNGFRKVVFRIEYQDREGYHEYLILTRLFTSKDEVRKRLVENLKKSLKNILEEKERAIQLENLLAQLPDYPEISREEKMRFLEKANYNVIEATRKINEEVRRKREDYIKQELRKYIRDERFIEGVLNAINVLEFNTASLAYMKAMRVAAEMVKESELNALLATYVTDIFDSDAEETNELLEKLEGLDPALKYLIKEQLSNYINNLSEEDRKALRPAMKRALEELIQAASRREVDRAGINSVFSKHIMAERIMEFGRILEEGACIVSEEHRREIWDKYLRRYVEGQEESRRQDLERRLREGYEALSHDPEAFRELRRKIESIPNEIERSVEAARYVLSYLERNQQTQETQPQAQESNAAGERSSDDVVETEREVPFTTDEDLENQQNQDEERNQESQDQNNQ